MAASQGEASDALRSCGANRAERGLSAPSWRAWRDAGTRRRGWRCGRTILRCVADLTNQAVAGEVGACTHALGKWRERSAADRLAGPSDEPIAALVTRTLEAMPTGVIHWSRHLMARASGLSALTVGRIWRAFGLRRHRVETFKLSADPLEAAPPTVEKVRDVVGLYLAPPDRALILCVDESWAAKRTNGVQALDRTQPLLPLRPGQAERRTHDHARHGTTSLFAALDVRAGTVIGRCLRRRRAAEFRRFLGTVESAVPADLDVHVVMDDAGIHKTKLIRGWFAERPRWHAHFTLISASWFNQVERFFALLTDKALAVHEAQI